MDENEQWKGIVHMMQHLIGDLQEQILRHDEEIRTLQGMKKRTGQSKPCKLCGVDPRMDGRAICLHCLQRYEYGVEIQ